MTMGMVRVEAHENFKLFRAKGSLPLSVAQCRSARGAFVTFALFILHIHVQIVVLHNVFA